MRTTLLTFAALSLATVLTACSVGVDGVNAKSESKSLKYSYTEEINGFKCTTGEQTFSDKAAYCEALKNDSKNNYCAESMRRATYRSECGSDFDQARTSRKSLIQDEAGNLVEIDAPSEQEI